MSQIIWIVLALIVTSKTSAKRTPHSIHNHHGLSVNLLAKMEQLERDDKEVNLEIEKLMTWKAGIEHQTMELEEGATALEKRNLRLDVSVESLAGVTANIKAKNEALNGKYHGLIRQLNELQEVIGDQRSVVGDLQEVIGDQRRVSGDLQRSRDAFKQSEDKQEPSLANDEVLLPNTTSEPSCLPSPPILCDSSEMVAFHVGSSPENYGTIEFGAIWLNFGNHYNPNTGIFTAPVSGVYAISYQVLADDDTCGADFVDAYLNVNSVANGNEQSASYSEVEKSGGTSITVHLDVGDEVSVYLGPTGCYDLLDTNAFNTFSGHLVYRTQ